MSFNPDPTKMAQEVLFSRKKSKVIHPSLIFNGKDVSRSESHKHLGLIFNGKDVSRSESHKHLGLVFNGKDVSRSESHKHLGLVFDPKLNFDMHLKGKFSIINNGIALLRKLRHSIPRKPLLSIYKTLLRPHVDTF